MAAVTMENCRCSGGLRAHCWAARSHAVGHGDPGSGMQQVAAAAARHCQGRAAVMPVSAHEALCMLHLDYAMICTSDSAWRLLGQAGRRAAAGRPPAQGKGGTPHSTHLVEPIHGLYGALDVAIRLHVLPRQHHDSKQALARRLRAKKASGRRHTGVQAAAAAAAATRQHSRRQSTSLTCSSSLSDSRL